MGGQASGGANGMDRPRGCAVTATHAAAPAASEKLFVDFTSDTVPIFDSLAGKAPTVTRTGQRLRSLLHVGKNRGRNPQFAKGFDFRCRLTACGPV